ncbi:MAG: hypothetical protein K2X38_21930 [Gemmataceae bacterium]|nr:hypothetical protein [Gemmataceae bacterium]
MRMICWTALLLLLASCLWLLVVLALLSIYSPKVAPSVGLYTAPAITWVAWLFIEVVQSPPSTWPRRI